MGVYGRGRRTRTLTGGFGDRCATINTIPLILYILEKSNYKYYINIVS